MFTPRCLSRLLCAAILPLSGCDRQKSPTRWAQAPRPGRSRRHCKCAGLYAADRRSAVPAGQPGGAVPRQAAGAGVGRRGLSRPNQRRRCTAGAKPRPAAGGAQLGSRRSATGSQRARHGAISRRTRSNGEKHPRTTALGSAYLNDPTDVMNAIQVMRQRAASRGTLKNTRSSASSWHRRRVMSNSSPIARAWSRRRAKPSSLSPANRIRFTSHITTLGWPTARRSPPIPAISINLPATAAATCWRPARSASASVSRSPHCSISTTAVGTTGICAGTIDANRWSTAMRPTCRIPPPW